jgi:hypothetical protein
MADCNPSQTPMQARLQLVKKSGEVVVDATEFRSVVGALRYLVHTRPDLAHSVSYVSRLMSEPHEDHLTAVKRTQRYIAGTKNHERGRTGDMMLSGYSDSDHAGDVEGSRSTSGILFYLGKSPITWQS